MQRDTGPQCDLVSDRERSEQIATRGPTTGPLETGQHGQHRRHDGCARMALGQPMAVMGIEGVHRHATGQCSAHRAGGGPGEHDVRRVLRRAEVPPRMRGGDARQVGRASRHRDPQQIETAALNG